jgi:hypothetical protein
MSPRNCSRRFYNERRCSLWFILASTLLITAARAETLEFRVPAGTLKVETKDPAIKVSLNGEELVITGAGTAEVRLKTGSYLFASPTSGAAGRNEILSLTKDDRVAVRVWALAGERAEDQPDPQPRSRDELKRAVTEKASEMVAIRSSLDERIWPVVSSGFTTTEAAKLLIAFFRGDGSNLGVPGEDVDATQLQSDLAKLRKTRENAFALLSQVAGVDAKNPAAPLVGTWEITSVSGAGGIAADALELFDPDPVGRKFIATNDSAALLTGAGFWLFDASYPGGARGNGHSVDFLVVVRSNTVYHALYVPDGDGWKLRISPMNKARAATVDNDPHDGSFVLTLRRAK